MREFSDFLLKHEFVYCSVRFRETSYCFRLADIVLSWEMLVLIFLLHEPVRVSGDDEIAIRRPCTSRDSVFKNENSFIEEMFSICTVTCLQFWKFYANFTVFVIYTIIFLYYILIPLYYYPFIIVVVKLLQ